MSLVKKSTTGLTALPFQLPVDVATALEAAVVVEKADYDSDPAAYTGKGETLDKFVTNAINAYL